MKITVKTLIKSKNRAILLKLTAIFFLMLGSGILNQAKAFQLTDSDGQYQYGLNFSCVDEQCDQIKYQSIIGGKTLSPVEFVFDKKDLFSKIKKINRKKYMDTKWKSEKWRVKNDMEGLMGFRKEIGRAGAVCSSLAVASAGAWDVIKMPFVYLSELSKANKSSKLLIKQFDNALENQSDEKLSIDTFDFTVLSDVIYDLIEEQQS